MYLYILVCLAQWLENTSWKDSVHTCFQFELVHFKVHCPGGGLARCLKHTIMNFRFGTESGCSTLDNHVNLELLPMNVLNNHVLSLWTAGSPPVSKHR